ncbi:hypothetical protein OCH74_06090 [Bifidobacterium thermacidophilum]|uniref:Uncharacterized protein n=1 Tax=Bifidobacterium thermacidophilum TaxID=246618 RepID=A0ABW8KPE5_9BIFI
MTGIRALSGRINVPMTVRLLVGGVLVALVVTLLAWGAMRAIAAVSAAVKTSDAGKDTGTLLTGHARVPTRG